MKRLTAEIDKRQTMSIVALLIGREASTGFPGKNVYPVLGRPMIAYPLIAARDSQYVERTYLSTDSSKLADIARGYGANVIARPPELATSEALGEDAFAHGYRMIRALLGDEIELIVLLFANAPTVTAAMVDRGVELLRADGSLDSAVSVSRYNMWSPLRARRLGDDGCLEPFVPFETFGDPATLNCDRDSQGDVYFADMGVSVVRPRCLEHLKAGLLPQKWMGQRIAPIDSWGGCDVDYEWQLPGVEFWLKAHGFSSNETERWREAS